MYRIFVLMNLCVLLKAFIERNAVYNYVFVTVPLHFCFDCNLGFVVKEEIFIVAYFVFSRGDYKT